MKSGSNLQRRREILSIDSTEALKESFQRLAMLCYTGFERLQSSVLILISNIICLQLKILVING